MSEKRLAVFISGRGSNLQVILDQKEQWEEILVISSREEAYGLTRAQNAGVESLILAPKIDWTELHCELEKKGMNLLFCAGFMKIIPASFIEPWQGKIFNLHPSLLPKYKGLKAIERAFEEGDDIGVSIHHVSPEVDAGEVVLQEVAVVAERVKSMNLEQVIKCVHETEHRLVDRWLKSQL